MVRRGLGDDWLAQVRLYQQPLAGYLWAVGVARAQLEALLVETFVRASDQPLSRHGLYALATRLAVQHGASEERCLLVLCCLEGFSYAEAAEMLDLSPAAVRTKVRRAKANFR